MSYQVLARKWRPRNFQEVVGQQHVLTALSNGLAQNRLHHAYLFSGTRGVGKTTIARILAKSLNCEQGVTATPCGQCVNCQAIDQGRFVDLLEIDAASRTKVDDTRELLDNVQYKPAQGRYKVYLIDEVHMLSKHSFNALLKTLEEPPEYVKFLLATTDPQKLPITVLSRCLQFHLKAILPQEIENQLVHILQHEQASFEHAALAVIAKAADGSMRDALSLTDQALAFGSGNIEHQSVLKMLGTIDNSHLHYLLHFIASGNVQKVFQKIEEFVHLGADFASLHQELASLCHEIALEQMRSAANVSEKTAVQLLAERLSPEEVQLYYQIAVQGYKDYEFAPNGKIALEMTVMRLLAFKPANYITLDENQLELPAASPQQGTVNSAAVEQLNSVPVSPAPAAQVIPDQMPVEPAAVEQLKPEPVSPAPVSPLMPKQMPVKPAAVEQLNPEPVSPAPVSPVMPEQAPAVPSSVTAQPQLEQRAADIMPPSAAVPEQSDQYTQETLRPAAEPVQSTPLKNITHSRNMLRSHRLKREEVKKLQATTSKPETAVKQELNAAQTSQPLEQSRQHVVAEKKAAVETLPQVPAAVTAAQPAQSQDSWMNDEQLPPLDAYQDEISAESGSFESSAPPFAADMPVDLQETTAISSSPVHPQAAPAEPSAPAQPLGSSSAEDFSETPFFTDEQIELPEIDVAKYVEDKLTDPWSLAIQQMNLFGLVKLLAKNSVMKRVDQQIILTLKADQQHLLNDSNLCEQLQAQLKAHFGEQVSMYIEVGDVPGELTAFESELAIFQQYLDNAKRSIKEDVNIQTFVRDYGAKIYENSIIPL
ncbi:DNA polymerase III subunit gamma/tau [Psychromonas aquimarina]|uniref:DNA polymerase III subunit gamma/tau n=1 Tax=Psychromonas aquimarina TaxID=444919 RepID=UPI0004254674|nr:DNA polymerase III subunit gamma/tau [Psychromonas aquimarina]